MTYISCNKKYADDLNIFPEEIHGQTDYDFFSQNLADKYRADDKRIMAAGRGEDIEEIYVEQGAEQVVHTVKTPVKDENGESVGILGMFWDITERKKADEELKQYRKNLETIVQTRTKELTEANQQLQYEIRERHKIEKELIKLKTLEASAHLAGGITHDFNNLLAVILGNIDLAVKNIPPGHPLFDKLHNAMKAVWFARDLVLKLATISLGDLPVKEVMSIKNLLIETATESLRGSSIDCQYDIPDNLWSIELDIRQMQQVFHNLITNAKEAMPQGGEIKVTIENVELGPHTQKEYPLMREGKYIKIAIQDEGVGIPEEVLPKIFTPYFSTKERGKEKGMGLGLSIVHSFVSKHEGYCYVDSKENIGTTVSIYLPVS